jgi:O-methyltransferase involved in polyketide biosynthesis
MSTRDSVIPFPPASPMNPVSRAAYYSAFQRRNSRIAYVKEISERADAEREVRDMMGEDFPLARGRETYIEQRYLAVQRLAHDLPHRRYLEIGAGLSPHGLEFTEPGMQTLYVATDLPCIIHELKWISSAVLGGELRPNLVFHRLDVTDDADVDEVIELLREGGAVKAGPVTTILEGVMPCLGNEGKHRTFRNLSRIHKEFGGAVVVTDIYTRQVVSEMIENQTNRRIFESIQGITAQDLLDNAFSSEADAENFVTFSEFGFKLERRLQKQLVPTLSFEINEKNRRLLSTAEVWILHPTT